MSGYLGRDAILSANDIKSEPVNVPEWGGTVLVQALNGGERDAYEQSLVITGEGGGKTRVNLKNARAKLVAMSIVDEKKKKIFSTADIEQLAKKSSAALERVVKVAQRLSNLSDDAQEKATEDLSSAQDDALHSS